MMYTINIYTRFALMAGGLLLGILLWAMFGFWYGILFILASIGLSVGYFLMGTIQSAAMMMQSGDIDAVERQLNLTRYPEYLLPQNHAYYYLLKGGIAGQRKDYDLSEQHYLKAESIGLPSDNEKAMVYLAIVNFRLQKNKWAEAEEYYKKLKVLNISEPMLKEQIQQVDQVMRNKTQIQAQQAQMNRPGFRGFAPGSKQTRPKPR
jgi:tetratricopeptide (TPR) repeat protein